MLFVVSAVGFVFIFELPSVFYVSSVLIRGDDIFLTEVKSHKYPKKVYLADNL